MFFQKLTQSTFGQIELSTLATFKLQFLSVLLRLVM